MKSLTRFRTGDTDSRIESSFKQTHIYKTFLKDESIKIISKNGIVTLSGHVLTPVHKSMALDTAMALPGVESVDYHIEIKGEQTPEHSDTWIGLKVKFSLLYHRSVSGFETEVFVEDGVVTLKGVAENNAQKDLTTEYAQDIEGVKKVKNEMSITLVPQKKDYRTKHQKIDDASITALVKGALMYHRSTSKLGIAVKTKEGEVTLTGNADYQAEKDLVTKLIGDIHGLKSVSNNMTVMDKQEEKE